MGHRPVPSSDFKATRRPVVTDGISRHFGQCRAAESPLLRCLRRLRATPVRLRWREHRTNRCSKLCSFIPVLRCRQKSPRRQPLRQEDYGELIHASRGRNEAWAFCITQFQAWDGLQAASPTNGRHAPSRQFGFAGSAAGVTTRPSALRCWQIQAFTSQCNCPTPPQGCPKERQIPWPQGPTSAAPFHLA